MKDQIMAFILDEEGASAVEYGILVAGISILILAAVFGIGRALNSMYTTVQVSIEKGG